jgi:hypothetical protein
MISLGLGMSLLKQDASEGNGGMNGGGGEGDGVTATLSIDGTDTIIPNTTSVRVVVTLSGVRAVDAEFEIVAENPFVTVITNPLIIQAGDLSGFVDLSMVEADGVNPFTVSASGNTPVNNTVEVNYAG